MTGISAAVAADRAALVSRIGRPALTNRFVDFWLLGGASVVVWLSMIAAHQFRGNPLADAYYAGVKNLALPLALVINYPHFILSYKLAYSRGGRFVAEHWFTLVLVPVGLAALLAATYRFYDVPVESLTSLSAVRRWLLPFGVNAQLVSGPTVGALLLTLGFNLMVLSIGWHYVKQVFGCVMVYARYDGYSLTPGQRTLTRYALLSMWMTAFVDNNLSGTWKTVGDFSYSSLDLPDAFQPIATTATLAGIAAVALGVFWTNYSTTRRLPSVNMVVPFISLYVWWLPQLRQEDFYFVLVPLFHSLQYLPFAYKMEKSRLADAHWGRLRGVAVAAGVVLAGWLAFNFVPASLDRTLRTVDARDVSFFLIAAMLFINIHHYFIDSVVWRFKDEPVRRYLLD